MAQFTLNIRGSLHTYDRPAVMGVINATPDSFYAGSRCTDPVAAAAMAARMIADGADMIDVGACSTRPGATDISETEEYERLAPVLDAVRRAVPAATPVSVDTWRSSVARKAVTECGADIINDISGGNLDPDMFDTVAELHVPYVLTHMRGTPADMMEYATYEQVTSDVLSELGDRLQLLAMMGVADVIVDPGFGLAKTTEQCYRLLADLHLLGMLHRPILVGVSRKSMITKLLSISADDALAATAALEAMALDRGASIIRTHDVAAAHQAVVLHQAIFSPATV